MKRKNVTFRKPFSGGRSLFGPGLIRTRRQSRVAAMVRKHRGKSRAPKTNTTGSLVSDVTAALIGQGYKRAQAKRMAQQASGSDFTSRFRSALSRNPMKKKNKKRKSAPSAAQRRAWAAGAQRLAAMRRKKNSTRRPRTRAHAAKKVRRRSNPKKLNLDMYLSPKNRQRLRSFLSRVTGKRVKFGVK